MRLAPQTRQDTAFALLSREHTLQSHPAGAPPAALDGGGGGGAELELELENPVGFAEARRWLRIRSLAAWASFSAALL